MQAYNTTKSHWGEKFTSMLLYPRLTDLDRQSEEQAENSIMMISDSPVRHLNQALFDKANHHGKPKKTSEYFAEQNLPCDVTTLGFEVDEKKTMRK